MAIRLYEPVGIDIKLWSDPRIFEMAVLEAEVVDLDFLIAQDDPVRLRLGQCKGFQTLEEYDDYLDSEWGMRRDLIDFFDYDTKVVNITSKNGAWFLPIGVESFCGEEVGREAIYAIDGSQSTFWQHEDNEAHEIIFKLRDYKKRVEKIRIYRGSNARSALNNLDIYVANSIGGLDDPQNLAIADASIDIDDDWNEIVFSTKQRGRYIRLTGFGSENNSNESRIRELEAWVTTFEYD